MVHVVAQSAHSQHGPDIRLLPFVLLVIATVGAHGQQYVQTVVGEGPQFERPYPLVWKE